LSSLAVSRPRIENTIEVFYPNSPKSLPHTEYVFSADVFSIPSRHYLGILVWTVVKKNVVRYAYDDFIGMQPPPKTGEIAVVVSSKTNREGHRKRLRFLKALKAHFGDRIEIFGRGIREVGDKWDAIAPFRYQIVMENSVSRHYFTEKITDAYLGFAYPFYYGCPNLSDYYPEQAFTAIDINQPDQAIATIEHSMRADLYSLNIKSIYEARDMTLNKYNLFPMLADICQSSPLKDKKSITLYPERRR
jgi:hypothetical protein